MIILRIHIFFSLLISCNRSVYVSKLSMNCSELYDISQSWDVL